MTGPELQLQTETDWRSAWQEFPYWLIAIIGFLVLVAILIFVNPERISRPRRNTYIRQPRI